jgi:hypothetical protein
VEINLIGDNMIESGSRMPRVGSRLLMQPVASR